MENAYDVALVTLELAEVHAALGRTAEVKALARHSAPLFAGQGVPREAQRALALFCRATEEERLTAELLHSLVAFLRRAQRAAARPPGFVAGRSRGARARRSQTTRTSSWQGRLP
jgi:hypothetical protein